MSMTSPIFKNGFCSRNEAPRLLTTHPTPNQAMQRTASKAATDVRSVCHPLFGCVAHFPGLAVADLVLVRRLYHVSLTSTVERSRSMFAFMLFAAMLLASLLIAAAAGIRTFLKRGKASFPNGSQANLSSDHARLADLLLLVAVAATWYNVSSGWVAEF